MRGAVVLLAVVLAAAGSWWLLQTDHGSGERARPGEEHDAPSPAPGPVLEAAPSAKPAPSEALGDRLGEPPGATKRKSALERARDGAIPSLPTEVGRLEGLVRDADGSPVEGAVVRLMRPPTLEEVERRHAARHVELNGLVLLPETTTGADGRFALDGVPRGIRLFVWVDSARGQWRTTLEALGGALDVALPRTFTIRGRVLDAVTGSPVEGLPVSARPQGHPGGEQHTRSGPRGEFTLPGLAEGDHLVEALAMLRRSDSLGLDPELLPRGMEDRSRVRATAGTEGLELRVWRGYEVSGRVETQDGSAPPWRVSIRVYARSQSGQADQRRQALATSEADGTFTVDALPEGAYELQFVPPPDATGAADAVAATWLHDVRAPASDLRVVLLRGAAVRGRLVDGQGRPVTGKKGFVYVREVGSTWGGPDSLYATLDGEGGFATPPLRTGRLFHLLVRGFPGFAEVQVADVAPGVETVVRLVAGGQILGRVLRPDGTATGPAVPVVAWADGVRPGAPGAAVYAYTGADGQFVLEGLTADRYAVAAGGGPSAYGACEPRRGVPTGEGALELTVPEGAPIRGRLVDPRGSPVQALTLQAWGSGGGAQNPADFATTRVDDREGRFLLPGLRPGRVRLLLLREGKPVPLGEFDAPANDLKVVVPDP